MVERDNDYSFFANTDCEYYPCHKVKEDFEFNCLFCYCPLYALGDDCEGNFKRGLGNLKDCSDCLIPHSPGGYEYVMSKMPELIDKVSKEN